MPVAAAAAVAVEFVRDLLDDSRRQSLPHATEDLFSLVRFAGLVVARARESMSGATEQDRTQLLELARRLGDLARALDDGRAWLRQRGSMRIRSRLLMRQLADLAEEADDAAENAALGASASFAERVHQELATVGR